MTEKNTAMRLVEIKHDPVASMQSLLDRLVLEGAAAAAIIVTYPGGRQVKLRSVSAECYQEEMA